MRLAGLQKLTLLDFPGQIACTVFTPGCNLRCPFCHNPDLVLPPLLSEEDLLPEETFFDFLQKRKGKLTGVAVTGGEPTLQPDLPRFLARIREMGFGVKLDTNGFRPQILKEIVNAHLVDYVAMDVKNCPGKYALTTGIPEKRTGELWNTVLESIFFLMERHVAYEFRTTVVGGLHTTEDILQLAQLLRGADQWFLQQYHPADDVVGDFLPNGGLGGFMGDFPSNAGSGGAMGDFSPNAGSNGAQGDPLPPSETGSEPGSVQGLYEPSVQMLEEMRREASVYVPSVRTRGI